MHIERLFLRIRYEPKNGVGLIQGVTSLVSASRLFHWVGFNSDFAHLSQVVQES